jgi:hypothetical protein
MVSAAVLVALNGVAVCLVGLAFYFMPQYRLDRDTLDSAGTCALLGAFSAGFVLLLTWPTVSAGWLRRGWYLVPLAVAALAVGRYVYLDVAYDAW